MGSRFWFYSFFFTAQSIAQRSFLVKGSQNSSESTLLGRCLLIVACMGQCNGFQLGKITVGTQEENQNSIFVQNRDTFTGFSSIQFIYIVPIQNTYDLTALKRQNKLDIRYQLLPTQFNSLQSKQKPI